MTIQTQQNLPTPADRITFDGDFERTELFTAVFEPDVRAGLAKYFEGTVRPLGFTFDREGQEFVGTGATIIPWEFDGSYKPAQDLPENEVRMIFNGVAVPAYQQPVRFAGVHIISTIDDQKVARLVDEAKLMDQLGVVSNTRAVVDVPPPPEATNAAP